ncbi:hypothetical protein PoB_006034800 [Plakobranchus ocellatus]|uniref:Uncharacterized protein n=1 Tax=Plakobranchus ocellatus TaxID=259542 RepID=A0AAV4CPQ0_9GAST|nr:hypothetical protein PoB_006034800 [Plakobranchus ocellatus]
MDPVGSGGQIPSTTTCYRANTSTSRNSGSSSSTSTLGQGSAPISHVAARLLSSGASSTTSMPGEATGSGFARIGSINAGPTIPCAASASMSPSASTSYVIKSECSSMAAPQPFRARNPQGCVSSILSSPALSLSIPGSSGVGSTGLASPYGMPSPTTTTGPHGQPQQISPRHLSPGDGPSGISTTSSSSSSSSTTPHGQQHQHSLRDNSSLGKF